jgi:energy-coupling factor transport system substrate-specific component
MNLYDWVTYSGDHTSAKLVAAFATSLQLRRRPRGRQLPLLPRLRPALIRALARYRTRFEISWVPAPRPA